MQTIAVIALVIFLVMLFRWLGPPVRRLPHETKNSPKTKPDEDVHPPMMMG
jgi:hypothetical protein